MPLKLEFQNIEKTSSVTANYFSSSATLMTSTVGVTILLMPKLFHQTGIILGSFQILTIGILIYFSTSMLCKAARLTNSKSYYETMISLAGHYRNLTNILYLLLLFGNTLVYSTFALKNLIPIINFAFHLNFSSDSIELMLLATIVTILCNFMILPFLFLRKLKIIKVISNVCASAVFFSFVAIIFLFCFPEWFEMKREQIHWNELNLWKTEGMFVCIGYYLLSFCFQQIAIEVSEEISPRTAYSTEKVIFANVLVSVLIYLTVSFVGYLIIYRDPDLDQMNNFITFLILERKNPSKILFVIDVMVCVSVVFANILNFIPTIKYLKARFNKKPEHLSRLQFLNDSEISLMDSEQELKKEMKHYNKKNTLIVWMIFMAVLIVNLVIIVFDFKLDFVFNLVSAIGGPAVLIVFPACFYLASLTNEMAENVNKWSYVKAYLVMAGGLILWLVSIIAVFVS